MVSCGDLLKDDSKYILCPMAHIRIPVSQMKNTRKMYSAVSGGSAGVQGCRLYRGVWCVGVGCRIA